jgi:hypothetical protein
MLQGARHRPLLYLSPYSGPVEVFDYKSHRQLGSLTGFQRPEGQCVDAAGDIWITDWLAEAVIEYAHAGIAPMKTLDTSGRPVGCSVDRSGAVAVATVTGNGIGDIEVFKGGSPPATIYKSQRCKAVWTPGYDASGNLYFEGKDYYSGVRVCEIPFGAKKSRQVKFDERITGLGASVMWDGKNLTLVSIGFENTYIYQAVETKTGDLIATGSTTLVDRSCSGTDVPQVFIVGVKNTPINQQEGKAVLGGNQQCPDDFEAWRYPRGGKSVWSLSLRYVDGESVSLPTHESAALGLSRAAANEAGRRRGDAA